MSDHECKRIQRGRHAFVVVLLLVVLGAMVLWGCRQLSLAVMVLRDCQADLSWGDESIRRPEQLLGIAGLRTVLGDAPSSISFIPRNQADVATVLSRWDSVRYLAIRADALDDADLLPISSLKMLRTLQIDMGTRVDGAFLAELDEAQYMEVLSLGRSSFIDRNASHVGRMRKLRYLDLSYTQLSDAGITALRNLTFLRKLDMSCTRVSGSSLKVIGGLRDLQELGLAYTLVEGADLAQLSGNRALAFLRIEGLPITADDIRFLSELPELGRVWCSLGGPELQRALPTFAAMPRLRQLSVVSQSAVPDAIRASYDAALPFDVGWCDVRSLWGGYSRQSERPPATNGSD